MIRIIDLPVEVCGRTYKIQLNDSDRLSVNSFLCTQQTVSATSTIPYNSGDIPVKFNTTDIAYTINVGDDCLTVYCSGTIYGKSNTVLWATTDWDEQTGTPVSITLGLGWVENQY